MTAISPLAPARFPRFAAGSRRSARRRRGAAALQGPARSPARVLRAGDDGRRHAHPLAHGGAAGALVPRAAQGRRWHGTGAGGQCGQCERSDRGAGPRRRAPDRRCGRCAGGLPAGRGLRQLDRRDRGAVAGGKADRRADPASRPPRGRRLARGRRRDHDHGHLPQGRLGQGRDRRRAGGHQRHRQGLRHDRAQHGHHARLRVHRREPAGGGAGAGWSGAA